MAMGTRARMATDTPAQVAMGKSMGTACLSEQTVKNHLYRMKQKVGADDRLGIVQVCRTQGFMV